jgi:hypothetical protein
MEFRRGLVWMSAAPRREACLSFVFGGMRSDENHTLAPSGKPQFIPKPTYVSCSGKKDTGGSPCGSQQPGHGTHSVTHTLTATRDTRALHTGTRITQTNLTQPSQRTNAPARRPKNVRRNHTFRRKRETCADARAPRAARGRQCCIDSAACAWRSYAWQACLRWTPARTMHGLNVCTLSSLHGSGKLPLMLFRTAASSLCQSSSLLRPR